MNRVTWLTNTGPFNKDVSDEELDGFMEALHALGFEPTITHHTSRVTPDA